MLIDCDDCVMQHTTACDDCIVTVLLETGAPRRLELDDQESEAVANLAEAGLVPELRLLRRTGND